MNQAIESIVTAPIVYDVTEEGLKALENKWSQVPDVTQKEGYALCEAACKELRTVRVAVEKRRKELKADALEYGRKVDSTAKAISERIEAVENPMKTAKEAEDARKEKINRTL